MAQRAAKSTAVVTADWLGQLDSHLPFASEHESLVVWASNVEGFVHAHLVADEERCGLVATHNVHITGDVEPARGDASVLTPRARMSLRLGGERLVGIDVPEAECVLTAPSRLRGLYLLTLVTDRRGVAVQRSFSDVQRLDAQLRSLCPAACAPHLASASAELLQPALHSRVFTSGVLELRRSAVAAYLRAILGPAGSGGADPGGEADSLRALLAAFVLGSGAALEVVDGSVPVSPSSPGPEEGVVNTALAAVYAAWIAGEGDGRGAEEEEEEGERAPRTARASEGAPASAEDDGARLQLALATTLPHPVLSTTPASTPRDVHPFALPDCASFDCLLDSGWAVVREAGRGGVDAQESQSPPPPTPPLRGQLVSASWQCLSWDGSSDSATLVEVVTSAEWHLGDGRHDGLPHGLSTALLGCGLPLSPGDCVSVVLSPALAYGEGGFPPSIPPGAHLVYRLTVLRGPAGEGRPMPEEVYLHPTRHGGGSGAGGATRLVIPAQASPVTDAQLALLAGMEGGGRGRKGGDTASTRFPGRQERMLAVGGGSAGHTVPPVPGPAPAPAGSTALGDALVAPKPKAGTRMPSPEEAEAAFRTYLAKGGASKGGAGSGSPPAGVPYSTGGGGIFGRLFKRGTSE